MTDADVERCLDFFRASGALKDTLRTAWTRHGRQESAAEHSWRLCLIALTLEEWLPEVDLGRLLGLLLVHDLAEALVGDVAAPLQSGGKADAERQGMATLTEALPERPRARLRALWEDYAAQASAEARLAKALDRLETLLQHVEGANPPGFDYRFNLGYGRAHTEAHPLVAALRVPVDAETARRAQERNA